MKEMAVTNRGVGVDRVGTLASAACALHCAMCALLPGVFATLGLGALLGHEAEWGFTLVAVVFAAAALFLGWRRHRSFIVVLALGAGIAGLLLARVLEESGVHGMGTILGVGAGVALVVGHLSNLKFSRLEKARV